MGLMNVECMTESSVVKTGHGKSLPPSGPGAVAVSTTTGRRFSEEFEVTPETVKALASITTALLSEMMSGDLMYLAMGAAQKMAIESGVSPEEFNRVKSHLLAFWRRKRAGNPMSEMFSGE